MVEKTTMVRASIELLEKYRDKHPKLKGMSYTAINEVMLREALGEYTE